MSCGRLLSLITSFLGIRWTWGSLILLKNKEESDQKELLEIGACGIHTVHCAFKHGVVASGWGINKVLSAMYKISPSISF